MGKKKSRKGRARQAPRMYPKGVPTPKSGRPSEAVEDQPGRATGVAMTGAQLQEQYWYVYNDLKRIAMVAGTLFAILIVLSFFI